MTIGGPAAGDRNYVAGNNGGGIAAFGDDLTIRNNYLGLDFAGTATLAGGTTQLTYSGGAAEPVAITGNLIGGTDGIGLTGDGATVTGNTIGVGTGGEDVITSTPLSVFGDDNTIGGTGAGEGNTIGNSGGSGITIVTGEDNTVQGNSIGVQGESPEPNGATGINVASMSTGNLIGGDTAAEENVISNSATNAVLVEDGSSTGNTVARNRGDANGSAFVSLANSANESIPAPTIDPGPTSESITGADAESGSTVRGELTPNADGSTTTDITAFVGQATVAGDGTWSLSCPGAGCPAEAPGTGRIAANQTDTDGNSSAITSAVAYTAVEPSTAIASGPPAATSDSTPTFNFSSDEDPDVTYECRIDSGLEGDFEPCSDPFTTPVLTDGAHTLDVRAVDTGDHRDATPASSSFTVDTTEPQTSFTSGPVQGSTTADTTPAFGFTASEGGSTFQCRLDGGAFASCTSPRTLGPLSEGSHTFQVRATDPVGNQDGSAASRTFTIDVPDTDPPETTIDSAPKDKLKAKKKTAKATYEFSADEGGSSFECSLDGEAFKACTSPVTEKVKKGKHTFEVRATDEAGNVDSSPADDAFKVTKKKKKK